jgi:hypothetical protein
MEDVVAIKIRDVRRGWVGAMTWGRLWDPIDDRELLEAIKRHLSGFGIEEPVEIQLCSSLREIESGEYFYEALLKFSWKPPAFGPRYEDWRAERKAALEQGREIYFVGSLRDN